MTIRDRAAGPFYHSFESYSEERREELKSKRLDDIIKLARERTPFYQDRLQAYNPQHTHPLGDVPLLTSDQLRQELPPVGHGLMSDEFLNTTVFQSGGTTGVPKTTLFTFEEMEQINELNSRGFVACGLEKTDRVANFWAVGGLYMTFIHMNRMLMEYGCVNFPFSNHTPVEFSFEVAKLFNINCFTGISSIVLGNLRGMKKLLQDSQDDLKIDKIFYGGEHFYDADREEVERDFGVKTILAPGYGTVDTWYIGYQCEQCEPGVFHAHDDQCYLEIVNEETGQPCRPGEVGMLLATPLLRQLTPIIRYRVGDRATWIEESCSCGRTTPLFKLLGRGDDVLRIGYDSVDYNFIQKLALNIKGLSGSIQMEKKRVEGKDQLIIRIETEYPNSNLDQEFLQAFMQERPSFSEFVKKGTIHPLKIELTLPQSLERNSRTGKLIRVKDCL